MIKYKATIYKHPKSNYIYLDLFYNGERKRPSTKLLKNAKNYKIVEDLILPKILMSMRDGTFSFDDKSNSGIFGDFAEEFFKLHKNSVRENTFYDDRRNYDSKIKPIFGKKSIDSIKPMDLEKWQNELLEKYSVKSVAKYRYIFQKIMHSAYINDKIKTEPFKKVSAPKKQDHKEIVSLDDEDDEKINPFNKNEVDIMLKEFKGYLGYFVHIMALTGMRPSEIIALEWKDIDFEKKRISVYKAVVKGKVGKPKSSTSKRYVDMIPILEDKLKEWYNVRPSDEYVFVNQSKKRFYSSNGINKVFRKRLEKYGIEDRYIYQLRHTFASTFISRLSKGVNIMWVSKMLGHKDLSTTLSVYTKFIKDTDEDRNKNLELMAQIWHT